MNKDELVARLKKIREQARFNMLKLAVFSAVAADPAVLSLADSAPEAPDTDKKTTVVKYSPADLTIGPHPVNIAPESRGTPIIEFENKVYDQNHNEVADYANATRYSLWDCAYKREVGNEANPVGVARTFYGSLQFNRFNAENMAIYALEHGDYSAFADLFFDKRSGFDTALRAFRKDFAAKGQKLGDSYLAYHSGAVARKRLAAYLKPDFKAVFRSLGESHPAKFLRLQRDYAAEVYCTFDAKNLRRIVSTLDDSGIKPQQVNPAVWGMFLAKHIKGGFTGIPALLKNKKVSEINSLKFVNAMAAAYPGVFKVGSGKEALKFAREHYRETHSITTVKELSMVVKQPEILENYLRILAHSQNGTLTWQQSVQLAQADLSSKISYQPVARPVPRLSALSSQNSKPKKLVIKPLPVELSKAVVNKKRRQLSR